MTWTNRTLRRISLGMAAVTAWTSVGCLNPRIGAHRPDPPVTVPEHGTVPTELNMVSLPEYVIEPPDVLIINAVIRNTVEEAARLKAAADGKAEPEKPAEKAAEKDPKNAGAKKPAVYADTARPLPIQPVYGEYQVRPDGTVFLGVYGSIPVSGLTLKQAAEAVRNALAPQIEKESKGIDPDRLLVVADVAQYNSKYYYVITDGGGAGEQVMKLPVTGKETVLDAISAIGGLSDVSSKRNIWVARRTPFTGQTQQILPVDWVGLTQWGQSPTNYQIFPGDRVYIKAQRLVTANTTLTRILAPVEKVLGVTLLGASTTNNIIGRGSGFGNTNR